MRRRPGWAKRPPAQPWTPEEDAKLVDMVRCGLSCDYWELEISRPFGEIAARRLELKEAGLVQYPRAI